MQQLLQAEQESLGIQLVAPIGPTDPGTVVQTHGQQDAVRPLSPQLTATLHLLLQPRRHPLQAIAAYPQRIEHGATGQSHPVAPQTLTPAALLGVAPAVNPAVPEHDQFARDGDRHQRRVGREVRRCRAAGGDRGR